MWRFWSTIIYHNIAVPEVEIISIEPLLYPEQLLIRLGPNSQYRSHQLPVTSAQHLAHGHPFAHYVVQFLLE